MKITVTFRHTDSTDALKDYAKEKIEKVERFMHSPQEAHIVLEVEKFRHIAEINILADGITVMGKEESSDLYSAIDLVMDKIERQLKKQKDRRKPRKSGESIRIPPRRGRSGPVRGSSAVTFEEVESRLRHDSPRIIPSNNFLPKPMSLEDAALELANRKGNIVVFRNSSTMNICVLHKMKNGDLGLVEAPDK